MKKGEEQDLDTSNEETVKKRDDEQAKRGKIDDKK